MNPRQRYLETLRFGRPDRVPLLPGGPRESTLARWHAEGLPEDEPYLDALSRIVGVPREAFEGPVHLPVSTRMIPTFEEKVLAHRDGHYIVQDWMGATTEISDTYDYTYIRSAKDFVTRKWHRFPVQSRADWEAMTCRYDPNDAERYVPLDAFARPHDRALVMALNGPFWQLREWVGMENLCLLLVDDPDLVVEMVTFWEVFSNSVLERVLQRGPVDVLHASEDMAYKAHSMISPAMARRFLQPTYAAWHALCRRYGCVLMDMDSDGYIGELIPVWMEAGFRCCNPIEVAAGNDLRTFRKQFGRGMAYHGGIDKRAIAQGGRAIRNELARVAPIIAEGGYIPGCDHGVPPDVSWDGFVDYVRLLAEHTGWL
ncbi:MAG: uroporphyrinogen decarboxylase/cobalamine-independent methonine synthase family protein [Anaerolineae bacterium]